MRERETDGVVVGAGGDGPALSWRLGQLGVDDLADRYLDGVPDPIGDLG